VYRRKAVAAATACALLYFTNGGSPAQKLEKGKNNVPERYGGVDNMIYRVERRENPFVQVDKGFINDKRLGFKEKGILLYFLSKPEGWNFYEEEIASNSTDGISSVKAGIKKLMETGYIIRGERQRNEKGQLGAYEYVVKEVPATCENPTQDFPTQGNPTLENHTLVKNEDNNIYINNNKENKDVPVSDGEQSSSLMERFEIFYRAYPKHKSRGDAERAWRTLKPNETLFETIMKSLETAKKSYDWQKENGKYIPYPATWLRAKGWEDEIDGIIESGKGAKGSNECSVSKKDSKPDGKFSENDFQGIPTF
jgi:hypothetical protein